MIVLLVRQHRFTRHALVRAGTFDFRMMDYRRALRAARLPRATYVFTDFDRLSHWELELAGRLYRSLASAGAKVLNDPARVRQRFSLLRTLKDRGINDFDIWRVEDTRRPDRFPVFLRREKAHQDPLSDLLHDEEEVRRAIEAAWERGVPSREMVLVEWCAEPVREGVFRKLSVHRVGDRMVPCLCVHDATWWAKRGTEGIAGEELYADELELVTNDRHADDLWPAFQAAEIEYGRADFGIVGGRVQVYEINTNPSVKRLSDHPFPARLEAGREVFRKLVSAFEEIDTPAGRPFRIRDRQLHRQRRRDRWPRRLPWVP